MEKVKVRVGKNGKITIETDGIKGGACAEIIDRIMKREPEERTLTGEFYRREQDRLREPEE